MPPSISHKRISVFHSLYMDLTSMNKPSVLVYTCWNMLVRSTFISYSFNLFFFKPGDKLKNIVDLNWGGIETGPGVGLGVELFMPWCNKNAGTWKI